MDSTTVTITVSAASEGATSHDSLAAQLNRLADELERKMREREEQAHLIGRIAAFSGLALSAGFVAWLLRSGSLLASFLVSLPAWRHFDPLPVLGLGRRRRKERDQKMREDHEQENREFQGLDRILKSKPQTTKQQDASRGRRPEA
jgi:Flp pilus assembly protein TadB